MEKDAKKIISEIKLLLTELEASLGSGKAKKKNIESKSSSVPKGALGAITMLMDEGFFDTPQEISSLMERLRQIGHYHNKTAIAMNLLNLTKRRILNRFKNKETKNWEYVIRK